MLEADRPNRRRVLGDRVFVQCESCTFNSEVIISNEVITESGITNSRGSLCEERINLFIAIPDFQVWDEKSSYRSTETVASQPDFRVWILDSQSIESSLNLCLNRGKGVLETSMNPAILACRERILQSDESKILQYVGEANRSSNRNQDSIV